MFQSDAASEVDDEQPINGEIQYVSPPRKYWLIIVAMLACIAVGWTTKEVVGSQHAKMERVPTDAMALFTSNFKRQKELDWGKETASKDKAFETASKDSADNELAWKGAGQKVGLQIWRIIKFKVVAVPKDEYGEFYDGDSYIVLNTYEKDGDLQFDIHYWIGKDSTQDEYSTAAYKVVELDTKLDNRPVQHKEVMNHESSLFKSYFDSMKIVKGGADSGSSEKVVEKSYETDLWVIAEGTMRKVRTTSSLKSENVYIIQGGPGGQLLYQWNGAKAPRKSKMVAAKVLQQFAKTRKEKVTTGVLEEKETSANHPVMMLLRSGEKNPKSGPAKLPSKMLRFTGSLDLEVLSGLEEANLKTEDVFFVDTPEAYWIWVGKNASVDQRTNSMTYAHKEVSKSEAAWRIIHVVKEGEETDEFRKVFTNA